jgi:menaquinone-dependent protoporphyrinogen oxidase
MKALVVYGSKLGGTEGLAEMIGKALTDHQWQVTVRSAAEKKSDVNDYDAVVVGGALYAGRWHKDARRFVSREKKALRNTNVWMFSSGPLGEPAESASRIPPVPQVERLMADVGARSHSTFGGRLTPDVTGFPASAMAKKLSGDWRDEAQARAWAEEITVEFGRADGPRQEAG